MKRPQIELEELKPLLFSSLDYFSKVFDPKTTKEFIKVNRLHLTFRGNDSKIMSEKLFNEWIEEWERNQ
jgi:hypothetical protein